MTNDKSKIMVVLMLLSFFVTACGGSQVVEKVVTVEVEKVVTVEVEKVVTVEIEGGEDSSAEPTPVPVQESYAERVGAPAQTGPTTLELVREREVLRCGGNANVPGFGYLDPATYEFVGFDIDFCRAIAAAVLGDAEAIEVRPVTSYERFSVLQAGEVDILIRNTTWTFSRDSSLGFNFGPTTFYDGQGLMARKDSGISRLADLEGRTVCVKENTTSETNLADIMAFLEVEYAPLPLQDDSSVLIAYDDGRCDAFTSDKSSLVSQQILLSHPEDHLILAETMSKEPLGPVVRHGDDQWFDIVKWVVFGTFEAEELGITSENVAEMAATSQNPLVRNLLGVDGELGSTLDLEDDFMVTVIEQVGNYGEIYNRHLGPDTVFNLPRGLNEQWLDGGLIYSPPFR